MRDQADLRAPERAELETLERALKAWPLIDRAKVEASADGLRIHATPNAAALRRADTGRLRDLLRVTAHEAARDTGLQRALNSVEVVYWPPDNLSCDSQTAPGNGGDISSDVMHWLKLRFADRVVSSDSVLDLDLGLDSIDRMELYLEIERRFDLYLPEEICGEVMTVGDLLHFVSALQPHPGLPERGFTAPDSLMTPLHRKWLRPRRPLEFAAAWILYALNRLVIRSYFRLKVTGREHLPAKGPYLIAVNHVSDLDHFIVAAALDWQLLKWVRWAGDKGRLFCSAPRRFASRWGGVLPADDHLAGGTLAACLLALRRGAVMVWFPEGWRSPDGRLQPLARGIGLLAYHTGVPIVPAVLTGTFEAMPRSRRFPRPRRLGLEFGRALEIVPNSLPENANESYAAIVEKLRGEMERLLSRGHG